MWSRRALFQIHLWTGIGVGLYMLMISITGSADRVSSRDHQAGLDAVTVVTPSGPADDRGTADRGGQESLPAVREFPASPSRRIQSRAAVVCA